MSRSLPFRAAAIVSLVAIAACDDSRDFVAPDNRRPPLPPPQPALLVVDPGAEVNPTIAVTDIQCRETGTVTVTLKGVEPEDVPLDLLLTLDESGSILSFQWNHVLGAALSLLDRMDAADGAEDQTLTNVRIGVIKFATMANYDLALTGDYETVRTFLLSTPPRGGTTNISEALDLSRQVLVDDGTPGAARAVLFITDGIATEGDQSESGQLSRADAIKNLPARLSIVGVGNVDQDLLNQMASPNSFALVNDFGAVADAFDDIAAQVLVFPAATDITFSADVPAGFTLVAGSASADKGTTTEGASSVEWSIAVLEDETAMLTYDIRPDAADAPAGGTAVAVSNIQLSLTTPISKEPFTVQLDDVSAQVVGCAVVVFLVIDEDGIDNGSPPNFFSDSDVNGDIAEIGLRAPLPVFTSQVGATIDLHSGEVGDEGWFALQTIPPSWVMAGPTGDGLGNFLLAGPGLGSADVNGDRESLLDKVPDVTPLRATGLKLLEGRSVCAVVFDSDISINYGPLNGSLKGANLGSVAFTVVQVTELHGFSSASLPAVSVEILDAEEVCGAPLELLTEAPQPESSSEPFDVTPEGAIAAPRIAFGRVRDNNFEIYVMNADGSGQTNLTNHPAEDAAPQWSPGGTWLAFSSSRDGNREIYVMNADGSGKTNLTADPDEDTDPQWSPDGTRIAFRSNRDGNGEIYVMNADGSVQTNLTNHPAADADPQWSPDGTRLAFLGFRDGNGEIFVMNADGSGQTNLTNDPAGDADPQWSPDGMRLAFRSSRDFNPEIYVMNADGSGQTNLTNHPAADIDPQWSPDGTRIAFTSVRDGNGEIYVMNADGSGQTNLTNDAAEDGDPQWSPDGTRIAFLSNRDGNTEIYVMNADGAGPTNLTNDPAIDQDPRWSNDK